MSESKQMVLIPFAVVSGMNDAMVCQIFQVLPDGTLCEPCEWIEPENNAGQLAKHDIQRMPFSYVGMLMSQNLVEFVRGVLIRIDKYPFEERERCDPFRQGNDPNVVN